MKRMTWFVVLTISTVMALGASALMPPSLAAAAPQQAGGHAIYLDGYYPGANYLSFTAHGSSPVKGRVLFRGDNGKYFRGEVILYTQDGTSDTALFLASATATNILDRMTGEAVTWGLFIVQDNGEGNRATGPDLVMADFASNTNANRLALDLEGSRFGEGARPVMIGNIQVHARFSERLSTLSPGLTLFDFSRRLPYR